MKKTEYDEKELTPEEEFAKEIRDVFQELIDEEEMLDWNEDETAE